MISVSIRAHGLGGSASPFFERPGHFVFFCAVPHACRVATRGRGRPYHTLRWLLAAARRRRAPARRHGTGRSRCAGRYLRWPHGTGRRWPRRSADGRQRGATGPGGPVRPGVAGDDRGHTWGPNVIVAGSSVLWEELLRLSSAGARSVLAFRLVVFSRLFGS